MPNYTHQPYPPPPQTQPPQQTQHQAQHTDPHIRTPHVELPIFTGDNPRAWILECEDLFSLVGIVNDQQVKWGLAHVRGQAKTWLSSSGLNLKTISWADLYRVLLERFPEGQHIDPMEQLKQVTTVDQYINAYETWMTLMKRDQKYLPHDFFVDRFLSGLKDNIKHHVQCQKPDTLLSAYWYAHQYEKSTLLTVQRAPPSSSSKQQKCISTR
jgi:hypothetical protein